MRPRVFPAEDGYSAAMVPMCSHASMRPRVFPAEDTPGVGGAAREVQASMRPRVFPAEDPRGGRARRDRTWCFNEAAGIPRGRLPIPVRVIPIRACFNEAAGIPRGRLLPAARGRGRL